MEHLPIIDIAPFVDEKVFSKEERLRVGKQVDDACREWGFFYLKNHGLTIEEMAEIREVASEFFKLPLEEKQAISIEKNDYARGYQRLGQNITLYAQDWHEGVDLYAPVGPDHLIKKKGLKTLSGTNPIPNRPKDWSEKVEKYIGKMMRLGKVTMRAVALGLDLQEDFFEQYYEHSFWVMRLIGYPPLQSKKNSQDEGISCGQHCDYGCLTILNTDDTKGALQVSKNGQWMNADPVPGCFVINIGDMLRIFTNDLYKSTLHRVIHKGGNYRISVPFFFEPDFEAVITPIEKCVKESGKEASYQPIMYGDHLLSKVTNNFDVKE